MDFRPPPPRKLEDNLLPMINVIFLLLIFFLLAAHLTQPEPFAVTPPKAEAQAEAAGAFTLHVAADGRIGFHDATGDPALAALAAARADHCATAECTLVPPTLTIRADAALPATRLASLMPRFAGLGFTHMELVATAGPAP